jgi:hypothetical protein
VSSEIGERRDRRLAWSVLAVALFALGALQVAMLPRLSNAGFGDIEFTGWSGPMGSRIAAGDPVCPRLG